MSTQHAISEADFAQDMAQSDIEQVCKEADSRFANVEDEQERAFQKVMYCKRELEKIKYSR